MNVKMTAGWFYGALIIALSVWILHDFLTALLAVFLAVFLAMFLALRKIARSHRIAVDGGIGEGRQW